MEYRDWFDTMVRRVIGANKPEARVFVEVFDNGLNLTETAEKLGLSGEWTRCLLHRAERRVRRAMELESRQ
jgi:DNA-directed RNA polymerase specialized sigma24 family protein